MAWVIFEGKGVEAEKNDGEAKEDSVTELEED